MYEKAKSLREAYEKRALVAEDNNAVAVAAFLLLVLIAFIAAACRIL